MTSTVTTLDRAPGIADLGRVPDAGMERPDPEGAQPGALPEADLVLGQALADVATIGILSERAVRRGEVVTEQLQSALNSRVIIEQAKGVLAQHGGLSMVAAFDRLRGYARSHNARLSEVARRVVETDLAAEVLGAPAVGDRVADRR